MSGILNKSRTTVRIVRRAAWFVLPMLVVGCAENSSVVRNEYGGLVVEGPLAGPYASPDEVVDALPLILEQPGATNGNYGVEYCAIIYRLPGGKQWYLSKLSSVVDVRHQVEGKKSCEPVDEVRDPAAKTVRIRRASNLVAGDAHNHPWLKATSGFSDEDLKDTNKRHWWITVEGELTHIIRLLILADGRRYKYVLKTRIVFKWDPGRRTWNRIGVVRDESGFVTLDPGKDW